MELHEVKTLIESIRNNIGKIIVGKEDTLDLILIALFCSGHVLLEDVPGVGKTMLSKCLAKSIKCDFKRVQFTPDLLPSDLVGVNYFNQKQGEFIFRAGPAFTNILLADEINRATPRTQSSLLECMEEKQITIDGETRELEDIFFVIATQNPVESLGTFPLPEAQLDRFFIRVKIGYPTMAEGRQILDRFEKNTNHIMLAHVCNMDSIKEAQEALDSVEVSDAVKDYIVSVVDTTRIHEKVILGVSPRGSLALMKASKVLAVLNERDYVIPDDIKYLASPILAHRMVVKKQSMAYAGITSENIVSDILNTVSVPIEDNRYQISAD